MAHHGETPEFLRELAEELRLGPTREFPLGAIHRSDEGELRLAVAVKSGKVVLAFGSPVAWVGFDPEQARQLGELLIKRAAEAAS